MKKQVYTLIAMAAVCGMMFTGCKKDTVNGEGGITLNATLERVGGPDSKMYIGENDIPHFFASGETVNVNGAECSIVGSGTGDNARYSIPGVAPQTDGKYYAVYPASIVVAPEEATRDNTYSVTTDGAVQCSIHFPHVQNYVEEEGKQKLDLPVGAVITDNSRVLRFYNLCSLVEVTYNPQGQTVKLTSIEVTAINKGLWGDGVAILSENNSKLSFPNDGDKNRVVLDIPNKTFNTPTTFYVIVPPYDDNTEFSVKLRFEDGHSSVTKTKTSVNLPRNSIVTLTSSDTPEEDTEISGYYSISPSCKVVFSKGNLQHRGGCNSSDDYGTNWHFADHQYDYYGDANVNGTFEEQLGENVDLFSFSCSDELWYYGSSNSGVHSYGLRSQESSETYYNGDFADWGELVIDGDPAKTWFTLSKTEWEYLLTGRPGARGLRVNVNIIGIPNHPTGESSIHGVLLFPDDWSLDRLPAGVTLNTEQINNISYDVFRRIEAVGCVLLPQCGYRDISGVHNNIIGTATTYKSGYYWTSTYAGGEDGEDEAYYIEYNYNATNYVATGTTQDGNVVFGCAVRLVKPAPGYTYSDADRSSWGPTSSK